MIAVPAGAVLNGVQSLRRGRQDQVEIRLHLSFIAIQGKHVNRRRQMVHAGDSAGVVLPDSQSVLNKALARTSKCTVIVRSVLPHGRTHQFLVAAIDPSNVTRKDILDSLSFQSSS